MRRFGLSVFAMVLRHVRARLVGRADGGRRRAAALARARPHQRPTERGAGRGDRDPADVPRERGGGRRPVAVRRGEAGAHRCRARGWRHRSAAGGRHGRRRVRGVRPEVGRAVSVRIDLVVVSDDPSRRRAGRRGIDRVPGGSTPDGGQRDSSLGRRTLQGAVASPRRAPSDVATWPSRARTWAAGAPERHGLRHVPGDPTAWMWTGTAVPTSWMSRRCALPAVVPGWVPHATASPAAGTRHVRAAGGAPGHAHGRQHRRHRRCRPGRRHLRRRRRRLHPACRHHGGGAPRGRHHHRVRPGRDRAGHHRDRLAAAVHHQARRQPDHRRLQPARQRRQHRRVRLQRGPRVSASAATASAPTRSACTSPVATTWSAACVLSDLYRGIFVDGPDAAGNRIMGNWIGFDRDGSNDPKAGIGVLVNTGATDTRVGSARPGGPQRHRQLHQGHRPVRAGDTRGTVIQGNLLCIAPGGATAECSVGMDHDFGPRDGLIGGDGPGELNVIGPTRWEGIELSHGWDPDGGDDSPWRITGNRIIGNWIGFRKDGRYDKDYPVGLLRGHGRLHGRAHLGRRERQRRRPQPRRVVVRRHPHPHLHRASQRGHRQRHRRVAARRDRRPLAGWGISLSQGLKGATLSGNVIRNAKSGGVGLLNTNVDRGAHQPDRSWAARPDLPSSWLAAESKGANHRWWAPRTSRRPGMASGAHRGARHGAGRRHGRGLPIEPRGGQVRAAGALPGQ